MQTPHACSRQLAAAAGLLEAREVDSQHPHQPEQVAEAVQDAAREVLQRALNLLTGLCGVTATLDCSSAASLPYCAALVGALEESCVLEHACRLLLLLAAQGALKDGPAPATCEVLHFEHLRSDLMGLRCWLHECPEAEAAHLLFRLERLLAGRCMMHAVVCLGLVTLCKADGGRDYGLPRELRERTPVLGRGDVAISPSGSGSGVTDRGKGCGGDDGYGGGDGGAGSSGGGDGAAAPRYIMGSVLRGMLRCLLQPAPLPPQHVSRELASRVCGLAVASAQAAGAAAGAAGGSSHLQPQRAPLVAPAVPLMLLPPESATYVALTALGTAWDLLPPPPTRRGAFLRGPELGTLVWMQLAALVLPPYDAAVAVGLSALVHGRAQPSVGRCEWAVAAAEWWRLAGCVLGHPTRATPQDDLQALLDYLGERLVEWDLPRMRRVPGFMPWNPPPVLAPALEGGFLGCLERLLRRAAEDPNGPAAALLRGLLQRMPHKTPESWGAFLPLLAYAEPAAAAALVATVGKLLRRAEAWGLTDARGAEARLLRAVLNLASDLTVPDYLWSESLAPPFTAARRLGPLVALAVREWLPPVSRLVRGAARRLVSLPPSAASAVAVGAVSAAGMQMLLAWLAPLAELSAPGRVLEGGHVVDAGAGPATGEAEVETEASNAGCDRQEPEGGPRCGGGGGVGLRDTTTSAGFRADEWWSFLLEELGAVDLVSAALLLAARNVKGVLFVPFQLAACCLAVAAAGRNELRSAVRAAGAAAASAPAGRGGGCGHIASLSRHLWWLRTQLGPDWGALGAAVEALARRVEEWAYTAEGGAGETEEMGTHWAAAHSRQMAPTGGAVKQWSEAAAVSAGLLRDHVGPSLLLLPRRCANPGCANVAGASEAGLGLTACAGCGAVGYCCRGCWQAHWRAGHKAACARTLQRGAAAAGGAVCGA